MSVSVGDKLVIVKTQMFWFGYRCHIYFSLELAASVMPILLNRQIEHFVLHHKYRNLVEKSKIFIVKKQT